MSIPTDLYLHESNSEKTGVIYRIYNRINGKSYIGKSINPDERIYKHLNGRGGSPVLRHALKKYGKDAFCVEILESDVPESLLSKMEILHIRFFNAKVPNGYNITDGGEGMSGWIPSAETRRRRSEALKGEKNHFYGKSLSLAHRQKIARSRKGQNKGKSPSPEHRRKISEANKGQVPWIKGKKHSAETRKKISETNTGKKHSLETRQKMSEDRKGRIPWNKGKTGIYSDEARKQMSEYSKGQVPWMKGKTHSDEARQKMSDANKGKKLSPEHRRKISESNKNPSQETLQKNLMRTKASRHLRKPAARYQHR